MYSLCVYIYIQTCHILSCLCYCPALHILGSFRGSNSIVCKQIIRKQNTKNLMLIFSVLLKFEK